MGEAIRAVLPDGSPEQPLVQPRALCTRPLATLRDAVMLEISAPFAGPTLPLGRYYPIIVETDAARIELDAFLGVERHGGHRSRSPRSLSLVADDHADHAGAICSAGAGVAVSALMPMTARRHRTREARALRFSNGPASGSTSAIAGTSIVRTHCCCERLARAIKRQYPMINRPYGPQVQSPINVRRAPSARS